MILTKEVNIRINSQLIEFYKNKGYKFNYSELTPVLTKDLSPGSHAIVKVRCDNCSIEKEIRYGTLKNKETCAWICRSCEISNRYATGALISNFKNKKLQKELANRNKEGRVKKIKKTKLERYGDENYTNREEREKTMLKNIIKRLFQIQKRELKL